MPEIRVKCPSCETVLKLSAPVVSGKAIKCPKCGATIRMSAPASKSGGPVAPRAAARLQPARVARKPAPEEEEAEEHGDFEDEEEAPRSRKALRREADEEDHDRKLKRKKKRGEGGDGSRKTLLWIGIGGGLAAVVTAVLIIVLVSGKSPPDRGTDEPPSNQRTGGEGAPAPSSPGDRPDEGLNVREPLTALALAPDGRTLIVSGYGDKKNIRVWDLRTRQLLRAFDSPSGNGEQLALSPDGKLLASVTKVTRDGELAIEVRELDGDKPPRRLQGDQTWTLSGLAFAPGSNLLVATDGVKIFGWDPRTGKKAFAWSQAGMRFESLCFFPDGKRLASGGNVADKVVRIWDVATGKPIRTLTLPQPEQILKLAISPDGKFVAASLKGLDSASVAVWNAETGEFVRDLPAQAAWVSSLVFLHDGKTLAYPSSAPFSRGNTGASADIALVDVTTGDQLRTLKGHRKDIWALVLTPDGKTLISGDASGVVKLWDLGMKK